jgi:hypothetical protein
MKISTTVLAAAAALLFAAPAHSQAEAVASQIAEADSVMGLAGLSPAAEPTGGTLAAGAEQEFRVELRGGMRYMIVGVCDAGCTDLDLTLSDGRGRVIALDNALDDIPVLPVTGVDGTFTVKVGMITCSEAQCHYGVRVFQTEETEAQQ